MIIEDLPELAAESFRLAQTHCGDCGSYHASWGYLRAAGFRKGAGGDLATLAASLAALGPAPRVLVAGSADTGQVAAVANALAGRDVAITLVDRCATPLRLCEGFAAGAGIRLETARRDIADLSGLGPFDAVLMHNFISFIPAPDRVPVLAALRGALAPGGRLVMFQRIADQATQDSASRPGAAIVEDVIAALEARAISLPESRDAFAARLDSAMASLARDSRYKAFATPADIEALLSTAGFGSVAVERLQSTGEAGDRTARWRPQAARYLFEAVAPASGGGAQNKDENSQPVTSGS